MTRKRNIREVNGVGVEGKGMRYRSIDSDRISMQRSPTGRYCRNCRRCGIPGLRAICSSRISFRLGFCWIERVRRVGNGSCAYLLCPECARYLCNEADGKLASSIWPSFIWHAISGYDLDTASMVIAMFPAEWREWWDDAILCLYPTLCLSDIEICTVDVSEDRLACEKSLVLSGAPADNMKDLSWVGFVEIIESCLSIPTVRCPWGCSEFIGCSKLNLLPLDVVVQNYVDHSLPLYSGKKDSFKAKRYSFRRDLFSGCGYPIMGNDNWRCCPSIIMRDGVPFFMACRFHTTKDVGKYIHVPTNPTGSVAFGADDCKAQVVAVPRTIAGFKKKKCSNSYSIRKICGNYSGIDSLNLCSYGPERGWNFVSRRRHLLSLACRSEYQDRDVELIGFKSFDSQDVSEAFTLFDADRRQHLKENFGRGASYVSLDDVFRTQQRLKRESVRQIKMQVRSPSGRINEESFSFHPVWCNHQLPVKEFGSLAGSTFPCFKAGCTQLKQNKDMCNAVFFLWNIILMVPEVWSCIDQSTTNNDVWYGWVLQYLSVDLLGYKGGARRKGHPFFVNGKGVTNLSKALSTFVSQCGSGSQEVFAGIQSILCSAMTGIADVTIIPSKQIPTVHMTEDKKVVMVLLELDDDIGYFPCSHLHGYELRFLGCKNFVEDDGHCFAYARHRKLPHIWKYERFNNAQVKFSCLPDGFDDRYLRNHRMDWRVLVYVRQVDPAYEQIKYDLLQLQGGQDIVWCEEHVQYPFVVLPVLGRSHLGSCSCNMIDCNRKQYYGCPVKECQKGICRVHLKNMIRKGRRVYMGGLSIDAMTEQGLIGKDGDGWDHSDHTDNSSDSSYVNVDRMSDSSFCDSDEEGSDSESTDGSVDAVAWDSNKGDDSCSVGGNVESNASSVNSFGNLVNVVNDLEDSDCDGSSGTDEGCTAGTAENSDEDDVSIIPVTSCVRRPLLFDVKRLMESGEAIPNHVLLNTHGNCLIRRRKKLLGAKRARFFLEKLACVSKGNNIPLLFPEGMMFPSVFWLREEEGSLVGSIPCCALMDNRTLDGLGLASLYDHSRTRLLDPTLVSSTNVKYLCFLWDMAANLGLRGSSATLVFNRGFSDMIKREGLKVESEDPRLFDYHQIDSRKTVNQLAAASARNPNDFFFTWTMNGLKTPGVRMIFDWCRSGGALEQFTEDLFNGIFAELGDIKGLGEGFDLDEQYFLSNGIEEAFGVFVVRAWMEFIPQFLYYLQYGADSPFRNVAGGVRHVWNHSEIQNNQDGNAPHNHSLIYMRNPPKDETEVLELCSLIRGSMETFCSDRELRSLKRKGFLNQYRIHRNFFDDESFFSDVKILLTHHCTKRCVVVNRKVFEGGEIQTIVTRKCKGTDYRLMNPQNCHHAFIPVPVKHEEEAIRVMLEVGMMKEVVGEDGDLNQEVLICPTEEFQKQMTAVRHCPSSYTQGYLFSPANPMLFSMLLSSMNLQFVTAYLLMRYLVKYCASVDKGNHLKFKAKKDTSNVVEILPADGLNTKITSNSMRAKEKEAKARKGGIIDGRSLSLAEMVMQFLQYPRVITTFRFENIPTGPMGMRTTVKIRAPAVSKFQGRFGVPDNPRRVSDVSVRDLFSGYAARKQMKFPSFRQYDNHQVVTFADTLFQQSSIDKVTQFSLRPPELSFITSYPKYHVWFRRSDKRLELFTKDDPFVQCEKLKELLRLKYDECPWIDAFGFEIRVRRVAVSEVLNMLIRIDESLQRGDQLTAGLMEKDFGGLVCFQEVLTVFKILAEPVGSRSYVAMRTVLLERFVCETEQHYAERPVYWFRTVRASRGEEFLYHLLLSLGHFKSEYEMYSQGCLRNAFVYCRLIPANVTGDALEDAVKRVVKKYAKHQLCFYPLGTKSFDRELIAAYKLLKSYLVQGQLPSDELPPALYTNLRDTVEEDALLYLEDCKKKLVASYCSYLEPFFPRNLPSSADLIAATQANSISGFDIRRLGVGLYGTNCAVAEHFRGRQMVMKAVCHYKTATQFRTRSICVVGAGGVGKTVDLRLAGLYCCAQGLYVLSTSLTGKRSAETAGEHIHVRFHVPVNEQLNVAQMADRSYASLLKDGKRLLALQRVDVLLLDEMGQLSVKLLSCLDYLMRRIRHSSHWMGGVLVITTMDVKQLKPIRGLPPIFSPAMLTSFDYVEYTLPLRTHDPVLMEIQCISRMTTHELQREGVRERFMQLAGGPNGFNFVSEEDVSQLPSGPEVTYCFAKHEPCVHTEKRILREMKHKYGTSRTRSRQCQDWEETTTQQYPDRATASTSRELDRRSGTSRVLLFYPYATFTVTYNDTKEGRFFNGQLCMILDVLPNQQDLDNWCPIFVYRAPHGVDEVPPYDGQEPDYTEEDLLSHGWEKVAIGKDPGFKDKFLLRGRGSSAYREQYGLRHRVSVTIHSVMGSTVGKLISKVDDCADGMWESGMAVVLLSRTRHASDMYFIGSKERTLSILWLTLLKGGQYNEACQHLLQCLTGNGPCPLLPSLITSPPNGENFCPIESLLPVDGDYAVYMIISLKNTNVTYIGHSKRLRKRLNRHNSSAGGSSGTGGLHRELAPWGLLCYVKGFDDKEEAMRFEGVWKSAVQTGLTQSSGQMTWKDKCLLLRQCMGSDDSYITVICGEVR